MKKVMAFGTFDILHPGHEHYLKEAKKLGDYLIVVVARDTTVLEVKGELPKNDEVERLEKIRLLPYVDEAVLGDKEDKYKVIKENNPDIICLGYDQISFTKNLKEKLDEKGIKSQIIKFTQGLFPDKYKSSILKRK